jgi:hypothetical protein
MPDSTRSLRPSWFALLGALVLSFLLTACGGDFRPYAVGPEGEVTVVIDSTHWNGAVGEALRTNIGPYVETLPVAERYFQFRQFDLNQAIFDEVKKRKNVVIIAPLSDSTNEANFLRRRLSEDARQAVMNGQVAVVPKPDLWRRSQRVYFITARSAEALVNALQDRGQDVRQTFKRVTLDRMQQEMFEKARQQNLEDTLMRDHNFAVNVQHDYQIALQETTDSTGFVWLRRVLTDTWRNLIVYYIEDASASRISPEWIYTTRDSLTRKYVRGNVAGFMRIDYRRPLTAQQTSFEDRYAYEVRGLWHMVAHKDSLDVDSPNRTFLEMGGGGPFLTYAFYDQASDRIYMVDGAVFAPGYDKLPFIRQMEVIAKTFRTRQEASGDASDEAVAQR